MDFEKAYDCVSWNFLRYLLSNMGFEGRWLKEMEGIFFTNTMLVLINGSTTKDFKVNRGLYQGDPISPFLFVLVTWALTSLMNKAVEDGDFHGF